MKKKIILALTAALLFITPVFASDTVNVTIDGISLETDTPAQIIEGRTLVPLRAIFEALNSNVEWNSNEKSITAVKDDTVVNMKIGENTYSINNESFELDVPAQIIDGRTLVPVRAIAESMGCDVEWDNESKTVIISTQIENTENDTEITTEDYADYIEFLLAENDKPAPIDPENFANEDLYKVHTDLRYRFEQNVLPRAVFNGSVDFDKLFENKDTEGLYNAVAEQWELNVSVYLLADLLNNMNNIADTEEYIIRFESDTYLYPSDNMGMAFCKVNDSTYMGLLSMADEVEPPLCSYIAIIYNKETGYRYITLERSILDDMYMLCEVEYKDGGRIHSNFGITLENNKEIFIKAVNKIINMG